MHDPPTPRFPPELVASIRAAARMMRQSSETIALTGAGLSVESGIPPFRGGAGPLPGLWERYDPADYASIEAFDRDPARVWRMLAQLGEVIRDARPNDGHRSISAMERQGHISGVITQNIDGLHQEAGSRGVIELHGNWSTMTCRRCLSVIPSRQVSLRRLPPTCVCGGVLKPDVTLFGEVIPSTVLDAARELAQRCDLLLVVGCSGSVAPAASIPHTARRSGAGIIEINNAPSGSWFADADLVLEGPAGLMLPALAGAVGTTREN